METSTLIPWSVAGTLAGAFFACIPGLHVASALALMLVLLGEAACPSGAVPFCLGFVAAYVIVGFIPVVFFLVPDEGLFFAVNPAQSMQARGLGHAAVMLGGLGAAMGIAVSSLLFLLIGRATIPALMKVLAPHWHWMVWAVVVFIVMSEWPQRAAPGVGRAGRFVTAWRLLLPGLVVFCAASALGLIVFFRRSVPHGGAFAAIMPMVTGIFSVPWLVHSVIAGSEIPPQERGWGVAISWREAGTGVLSGCLGGIFACIAPGVTAGVGGLLAGHACSLNGKAGFLIAQGCARSVYMCGAIMLLFVPGATGTRGACAMMIRSVHEPYPQVELAPVLGAFMLAASLALALTRPSAAIFLRVVNRVGRRRMASLSLISLLALNFYVAGLSGILVLGIASAVGGSAMLYGVRRMNCLACILVPVGIGLSGWGGLFQ